MTYDCASIGQLQGLTSCSAQATYSYSIVNRSNGKLRLSALLDSNFVNLANNQVLNPFSETTITKTKTIKICEIGGTTIKSTGYALASPVRGGIAASARDSLTFELP